MLYNQDNVVFIYEPDLNPLMAGFLPRLEDWKCSSSGDFCGMKELIELDFT